MTQVKFVLALKHCFSLFLGPIKHKSENFTMELVVSTIYTSMHLHLKSDVINAQYHGWHKGWGYGAAATPDFKDAP